MYGNIRLRIVHKYRSVFRLRFIGDRRAHMVPVPPPKRASMYRNGERSRVRFENTRIASGGLGMGRAFQTRRKEASYCVSPGTRANFRETAEAVRRKLD